MNRVLQRQIELALDALTDHAQLEQLAVRLLEKEGHRVERRGGSGDGGIDFVMDGRILGQTSGQKTWETKLRLWLRDVQPLHPEAAELLFVTSRRAGGSRKKESLSREVRESTGRSLEIRDRDWFVRRLLDHPLLIRDALGIPVEQESVLLSAADYGRVLANRTFARHFAGELPPLQGRSADLDRLASLLAGDPKAGTGPADVLIIVGTGGVGKSRLALEAVQSQAVRSALPGASWVFVRPDRVVTDAALVDLPESGLVVCVLDDPQRQPNDGSLQFLRTLLDGPTQGRKVLLVLTTRPAHVRAVRSLLAPCAALRVETLDLAPLLRGEVNAMLQAPPLAVASEEARAWIVNLARGLPSIAEAAVHVFRSGGGLRGLQTGDAVWSLVDQELGSEDLLRMNPSLDRSRAAWFVGILAAFPTFPWADDEARRSLLQSCRLDEVEANALREHLVCTGLLQESKGGLAMKPDIVAESALAHLFFADESAGREYRNLVWEPFAGRFEGELLKRLGELSPGPPLKRFLAEILRGVVAPVAQADNRERSYLLERLSPLASLVPDLILRVGRTVIERPAPDQEDVAWGIPLRYTHTDVVSVLVGMLRQLLRGQPPSSAAYGEALDVLLEASESVVGHGPDAGAGFESERRAAPVLAKVARLDWNWVPGSPPDLDRARRDLERFRSWFLRKPGERGRLLAMFLNEAVRPEMHATLPSAASKETFRLVAGTVGRSAEMAFHRRILAGLWMDVSASGDVRAQYQALDVLKRLLRDDRSPEGEGPSAPQGEGGAADALLAWLEGNLDSFETPARARLLYILAALQDRTDGDDARVTRLIERLSTDGELELYGNLVGHYGLMHAYPCAERDLDEARRRRQQWHEGQVSRILRDGSFLEPFLARVAELRGQALAAGAAEPSLVGRILFDVARGSLERGLAATELLRGPLRRMLGQHLACTLSGIWKADATAAERTCRQLQAAGDIDDRKAVACSVAREKPHPGQLELAIEIACSGDEPAHLALLEAMRWLQHGVDPSWTDVVLALGRSCSDSLVLAVLERLLPPGVPGGRPYADFPVPAERRDEYVPIVQRAFSLPELPDDDHVPEALGWLARTLPEKFLSCLEERLRPRQQLQGRFDPLPDAAKNALHSLPEGIARHSFVASWLQLLREGRKLSLAREILETVLSPSECDRLAREAASAEPQPDLPLLRVVLPRVSSREAFNEILARLVARVDSSQWDELFRLVRRFHGFLELHAGPQLPAWDQLAEEIGSWEHAADARIRAFARWARSHLRQTGRDLHGDDLDEYEH